VRWLGRGLAVLLVVALLAAAAGYRALQASRAERAGTLTLAGLEAPVEIRFDPRARPFVRAETLGDAFFAQGVLHARERLWQMELLSRAGRGRLAEILGPSLLATDRKLWRSGVPRSLAQLRGGDRPHAAPGAGRRRAVRILARARSGAVPRFSL
jgi:penicillin amidase